MHDGRANTLHDAILLHGGQGSSAAEQYRRAPDHEKTQLVSFLQTLQAP